MVVVVMLVASVFLTILCTASGFLGIFRTDDGKLIQKREKKIFCGPDLVFCTATRITDRALILVFSIHKGPILRLWAGAAKQKNDG